MMRQRHHRDVLLGFTLWVTLLMGGCTKPFHLWQADITSTPALQSFDVSELVRERVVILAPAAYNHLQGYIPFVSQGLRTACSQVSPTIRVVSQHETMNTLSKQEMVSDYREEEPDYAPSNILDRQRLGRIHKALAAKYVLQPGLARFTESTEDRFELADSY